MSEFRAAVINDLQVPFHCKDAIDVAVQIMHEFRPQRLVLNGDIWDLMNLSAHPNAKTEITEKFADDLDGELDRGIQLLKHIVKEAQPEDAQFNPGNHCFRVIRTIHRANGNEKKLLETKVMRNAYSYRILFGLDELGIPVKFAGEYPNGQNIHPGLPHHLNVWAEHGMLSAQKTGYTGQRTMEKRMGSVIVGHCERLGGPNWTHVNGDRNIFNIENGNLSILGVPGIGDGIYSGIYHSNPDYMNHTQGFTLLTHHHGEWWQSPVAR